MYVNQLSPTSNPLMYVPDYLAEEEIALEVLPAFAPYLSNKMRMDQLAGYLNGLCKLQKNIQGMDEEVNENAKSRWFSTDEVKDVRVFFRRSTSDNGKTLGSKMRLYSLGKAYRKDIIEVQHLDSGFITHNTFSNDNTMVFQNAISTTMLYKSLYSIGGRANVRKTNEVAPEGAASPTYKWVSALRPQISDNTDWREYTHILHPAAIQAGIKNPEQYFSELGGNRSLDGIMDALTESKSIEEFADRMVSITSLELYKDDVEEIIERSNTREANLSYADDFDRAEGVNVVEMMRVLKDIFDEE